MMFGKRVSLGPDREDVMTESEGVRRRDFLRTIGASGAAAGLAGSVMASAAAQSATETGDHAGHAQDHPVASPASNVEQPKFFTSNEMVSLVALVDTLIPNDDVGPGGVEVGVPTFIDGQMADGYGSGARMYLLGPFAEGTPQQGYQLPLTLAELYRIGLADLNTWCAKTFGGRTFDQLGPADRVTALKLVEQGHADFAQVPPRTFFNSLLQNTMEGYFGDPLYGGNRDKAVWKMIGFPGAIGMYIDAIEVYRNRPYDAEPKSIQELG
jgi:gluconate 2-dehydrogenase gamma chain